MKKQIQQVNCDRCPAQVERPWDEPGDLPKGWGIALVALTLSCAAPARDPEAEAETAYGAELQRCAATAESADAAYACMDHVRARWNVTMTEADGWSGTPDADAGSHE